MDEAQTWDYTRLSSLSQVWHELRSDPNSESQMPLGMLASWGWCRVFGTGEMATRSLNLVWAALALAALALVARRIRMPWLPVLFALQPFVWYSMDQARTPLMQMAGGAMLLAGTIALLDEPRFRLRTILLLSIGSIILCGASMLGAVPVSVLAAFLLASVARRRMPMSSTSKSTLFLTLGGLAILGCYYLTTLARGAGGAKLWAVTPFNLIFVGYEFLGFLGLGPGRQELRDILRGAESARTLFPFVVGWGALAGAYALVVVAGIKSWFTRMELDTRTPSFRLWIFCAGVPAVSGFVLYFLASVVRFPFWGRHLAGTLPFAVTALALLFSWSMQGLWRRAGCVGCLLVFLLLAVSSVRIRYSSAHRHDDYQSAARLAVQLAAEGRSVCWVADPSGGAYYGLCPDGVGGEVRLAPNPGEFHAPLPDVVILSRPENFDRHGSVGKLIASGAYKRAVTFQAFEVWRLRDLSEKAIMPSTAHDVKMFVVEEILTTDYADGRDLSRTEHRRVGTLGAACQRQPKG